MPLSELYFYTIYTTHLFEASHVVVVVVVDNTGSDHDLPCKMASPEDWMPVNRGPTVYLVVDQHHCRLYYLARSPQSFEWPASGLLTLSAVIHMLIDVEMCDEAVITHISLSSVCLL